MRKAEHERRREQHRNKGAKAPQLSLAQARARKFKIDWSAYTPPAPSFTGLRAFEDYPLEELVPYIDWMPFFNAWEFAGKFPGHPDAIPWSARRPATCMRTRRACSSSW